MNAGKRTRRMDLKDARVRGEFLDLVKDADVLVESFRPGVMARLGLDYATLTDQNSALIYCSVSGFGAIGPLAQKAAHDLNYLSLAGAISSSARTEPAMFETLFADNAGALFAALTIVAALHSRTRDARGCHIDLALADAVMPLQLFQVATADDAQSARSGRGHLNGGSASYRVYATADERRVSLAAVEPRFWKAFCEAAGRPDWIPRRAEPLPQTHLIEEVAAMFWSLSLTDCERRFEPADCCFTPVLDLRDAVNSPHVRARGLIRRSTDGTIQPLYPAIIDCATPAPRPAMKEDERAP